MMEEEEKGEGKKKKHVTSTHQLIHFPGQSFNFLSPEMILSVLTLHKVVTD